MAAALTGPAYNAKFDANRTPSLTAVSGTPGTSDTTGTAEVIRVGANPATGAMYVEDLSGASGTTNVSVLNGTLQSSGTTTGVGVVSNLTNGSVNILTGTVTRISNIGTLEVGTVSIGSIANVGVVHNAGTIAALPTLNLTTGTLTTGSLTNIAQIHNAGTLAAGANNIGDMDIVTGTQQTLGTVGVLNNGTVTGTVVGNIAVGGSTSGNPVRLGAQYSLSDGVGTLKALNTNAEGHLRVVIAGEDSHTAYAAISNSRLLVNANGTIQNSGTTTGVGVVSNLTNGSINILTGTLQSSGTTTGVGVVSNLTNGSVNILTGTLTSVTNLAAGTVQVNPVPIPTMLTFGTLGTAGGSFFATISGASGAGTKHYVAGVDVIMDSGTADVRVLAGSAIQGTGVLGAGKFPPGGGISKQFIPVFATGTNSELIYHFVGAGTAFITVQYWQAA